MKNSLSLSLSRYRHSRLAVWAQLIAHGFWIFGMPVLQAIHVPDPAVHVPGQPATFVPLWQGAEPEPPEGADLGDLDLDGLPAWYELWLGTDPGDPDSDDDGATDLEELQDMGTDPRLWDSNENGVGDLEEWLLRHADTDADGLSDWDEIHVHGTDPAVFDTDGDGLGDGYEVATTRQAPVPEGKSASDPLLADSDQDGLGDALEGDCYFPSDWRPALAIQPLPAGGLPPGVFGAGYTRTFTLMPRTWAAGWGPYAWDADLPSGLALSPSADGLSCVLGGTVEAGVGYSGTHWIRVTDAHGHVDQLTFDFQVDGSVLPPGLPQIMAVAGPPAPVAAGEFFSCQFGTTPHEASSWWLSGLLPAGLGIGADGLLSGTVAAYAPAGTYGFTVHALVEGVEVSAEFSLPVQNGAPPTHLTIEVPDQPLHAAILGSPYQAQFGTNYPGHAVQWALTGDVPAGLAIHPATGLLSGTVSDLPAEGMAQFTVHAWTQAESASATVWLPVQEAPAPTLGIHAQQLPLPGTFPGGAFQMAFHTSPVAATDWQVAAGDLPPGLSLGQDGLLSGTVEASATPGWYAFTLSASAPGWEPGHLSLEIEVASCDPDADADGDGLSAALEQELSQETGLALSDADPASLGCHDWLIYYFVRLAPGDTDTDGDGLGDQLEQVFFQTNPHSSVTGPSHTPDVIRLWLAYFQFFWDTGTDTDGDGLPDCLEGLLGLNPSLADTDGDGLDDAAEAHLGGWFAFGTEPAVADTDLDGLPDGYETSIGTDPRRVDTDGDHLTDYEEAQGVFGPFSPLLYDTDDDGTPDFAEADLTDSDQGGIPDRLELHWGMDPHDARDEAWDVDSNGVSNRDSYLNGWDIYAQWTPQFDDDNDGMTNIYETARGLNPADPTDGADDPDGDFLTNAEEARAHTSPFLALTPGFENTTVTVLDAHGNPTGTRQAADDYEAATGHSLRPPLPGLPALARDNGPDPARQHEDDWDGDGTSNWDELYPAAGDATDPRVFDAQENPLGISLGSGSTQVVQGCGVSLSFTAQGGAPPYHSWGLSWQGGTPEGLSWDAATATLHGTAQVVGTHAFTIHVSDLMGGTASLPLTLVVTEPPPPPELEITTSGLPAAVQGRVYGASLQATGALDGIAGWTLTGGNLPDGVVLHPWGSLSGLVEAEPDAYSFSVQVTDGAGRTASASFAITVTEPEEPPPPPPTPLSIQTSALPVLTAGREYAFTPLATGGAGQRTWQITGGSLPQGLSFSAQTGAITGWVTQVEGEPNDVVHLDIRVTDTAGGLAQRTLALPVQQRLPEVTTRRNLYWLPGMNTFFLPLEAQGGFPPYLWQMESGSLPPGVGVHPLGRLQGGPRPASGSWSFRLTCTDIQGQEIISTQPHQLILGNPPPRPPGGGGGGGGGGDDDDDDGGGGGGGDDGPTDPPCTCTIPSCSCLGPCSLTEHPTCGRNGQLDCDCGNSCSAKPASIDEDGNTVEPVACGCVMPVQECNGQLLYHCPCDCDKTASGCQPSTDPDAFEQCSTGSPPEGSSSGGGGTNPPSGGNTPCAPLLPVELKEAWSDQITDVEANGMPDATGNNNRSYIIMGARQDGKGHAKLKLGSAIAADMRSKILWRLAPANTPTSPSSGNSTYDADGTTVRVTIDAGSIANADDKDYVVVVGYDQNGDGNLASGELLPTPKCMHDPPGGGANPQSLPFKFTVVSQARYTSSKQNNDQLAASVAGQFPSASELFFAFGAGTQPPQAMGYFDVKISRTETGLTHPIGIKFTPRANPGDGKRWLYNERNVICQDFVRAQRFKTAIKDNVLNNRHEEIAQYFADNPGEETGTFSWTWEELTGAIGHDCKAIIGILNPFEPAPNMQDVDMWLALGKVKINGTVTIEVHWINQRVTDVWFSGTVDDIYDFDYDDKGVSVPFLGDVSPARAAEVQAGFDTLGPGGGVFLHRLNYNTATEVPLTFDFFSL